MKKTLYKLALACSITAIFLSGCSSNGDTDKQATSSQSETNHTFTDDLDREIKLTGTPKRVVTLIGSFTDMWMLAGGTVVGACDDSWASLNLDLPEDVVNIGKVSEPNLELILSTEPDFIIGSVNTSANIEFKDTFESLDIPVAYFDITNFEDYLDTMSIFTALTDRQDLFEKNGLDVRDQIDEAKKLIDGSHPEVLYLRTSTKSIQAKSSEGNVCGEILKDLGCVNIADSDSSLIDNLSLEAIMKADPEYIFVTPQGSDKKAALKNIEDTFTSNPAWQSLTAVKEGKYYVLDPYLFNLKPNERWGESYEVMADILYGKE